MVFDRNRNAKLNRVWKLLALISECVLWAVGNKKHKNKYKLAEKKHQNINIIHAETHVIATIKSLPLKLKSLYKSVYTTLYKLFSFVIVCLFVYLTETMCKNIKGALNQIIAKLVCVWTM